MAAGIIYIAECKDRPGIVKVGKTTKAFWIREQGLPGQTSLEVWRITEVFDTLDCDYSEKLAHARLEALGPTVRLSKNRELFAIAKATARQLCAAAVAATPVPARHAAAPVPGPVTHPHPLWSRLLKARFIGQTTLAQLIADATFGRGAAASKLRRLGLECVRFDFERPVFEVNLDEEGHLARWLSTRGHTVSELFDNPGQNTTQFHLAQV